MFLVVMSRICFISFQKFNIYNVLTKVRAFVLYIGSNVVIKSFEDFVWQIQINSNDLFLVNYFCIVSLKLSLELLLHIFYC